MSFETEWTADRIEENEFINRVRRQVAAWRKGGHVGVTSTTRCLLQYWRNPERERRLFFCQIEAVETAIYIAEVAKKSGDAWASLYTTTSYPFDPPSTGKIAVKAINHYGDEVLKVIGV